MCYGNRAYATNCSIAETAEAFSASAGTSGARTFLAGAASTSSRPRGVRPTLSAGSRRDRGRNRRGRRYSSTPSVRVSLTGRGATCQRCAVAARWGDRYTGRRPGWRSSRDHASSVQLLGVWQPSYPKSTSARPRGDRSSDAECPHGSGTIVRRLTVAARSSLRTKAGVRGRVGRRRIGAEKPQGSSRRADPSGRARPRLVGDVPRPGPGRARVSQTAASTAPPRRPVERSSTAVRGRLRGSDRRRKLRRLRPEPARRAKAWRIR